jgi:hypothetical protein
MAFSMSYGIPEAYQFPSGNSGCETIGFQFGKEQFPDEN